MLLIIEDKLILYYKIIYLYIIIIFKNLDYFIFCLIGGMVDALVSKTNLFKRYQFKSDIRQEIE